MMGGSVRSDWVEVELGLVCEKVQKVKRKEMLPHVTFLYLDIGGIDNQLNRIAGHKTYTWEKAPSRAQQVVKVGDVLFSTVRTYLKNIALVIDQKYEDQICSSGFTVIRGKEKLLESAYALYLSLYEGFLHPLNELQTGTSYPAVRDSDVFAQIIPLPSVPEQSAIVAKIEQVLSKLDHAIVSFKAAQKKLAIYRQSVLKKAFEGRLLTEAELAACRAEPDWEPAQQLLARAQTEKRTKPKTGKSSYVKVGVGVKSDWVDVELGLVCDVNMGQSPPSSTYNSDGIGLPFFQGKAEFTELHPVALKWCDAPKKTANKNDVLISVRAPVGATNIATEKCAIGRGLAAISYHHCYKYIFYYLRLTEIGLDKLGTGTTFKAISGAVLKKQNLPLAPLPEQRAIVKKIETRFSVCDHLQQEIEQGLQKAEALCQSVLKKAFEGRLLTETELANCRAMSDWEPAQQLLARIQSEKSVIAKKAIGDKSGISHGK